MADAPKVPRTFKEVPGWRESFIEAASRLDAVRTGSLFTLPETLCGERVRAFTLADWTVLEQARNPYVCGGVRTVIHAAKVVWLLSRGAAPDTRINRFRRAWLIGKILRRANYDELAVIDEVADFVDDAFLDMPGRFTSADEGSKRGAVNWPRKCLEIELCSEIMAQFPSFTYEQLRQMPLAQFWQWLHESRSQYCAREKLPAYRNYQLTDEVNALANREVNRARQQTQASGKN